MHLSGAGSEPRGPAGNVRVTMDQRFGDGSWATTDEVAVAAGPKDVMHVLRDMDAYPRWWPGMHVRLRVHTAVGVGSEGDMAIGPLRRPTWRFRVQEIRDPDFLQLELRGGLVGRAAWELEPHGALTAVRFAWYGVRPVSAASRLLVRLCEVRWHHLVMRWGLLGLKTRLECGPGPAARLDTPPS
jgi:uncharacterized protein YndB with AHSA1/START domain